MKPLGRGLFKQRGCKHKPKDNGKNMVGWWEECIAPNKTKDKKLTLKDIEKELDLMESEIGLCKICAPSLYFDNDEDDLFSIGCEHCDE